MLTMATIPIFNLSRYDLLLVLVVSLQATVVAYLHRPFWKGVVYILPLPFTFAALALGQPVDATNVVGLLLGFQYIHGVRWLYADRGVPIVAAIAASALTYALLGWGLAAVVPATSMTFGVAVVAAFGTSVVAMKLQPHRTEPGHQTTLPVWQKLPIIAAVILLLVISKHELRGFMTMFPMVGLVAAYEARHSLWTMSRKIAVQGLATGALMIVCRLTQSRYGLSAGLALGWVAYLAMMIPLLRAMWRGQNEEG